MDIPSYQELMLPLMTVMAKEERELSHSQYTELVAKQIGLDEEARSQLMPNGKKTYIYDRATWAGWYLRAAGLLKRPKRGYLEITDSGINLMQSTPKSIDNKTLEQYPEFVERVVKRRSSSKIQASGTEAVDSENTQELTPEERIGKAHQTLNDTLASELLDILADIDAYRFEQIVVDLLFAMGYGGLRDGAAQVTKKSNDEGIDGFINEDPLGLDVVYVQAKKWKNSVGRKEIQSFVGALVGKQANKGVFITTGNYAQTALDYAESVVQKVILIGGEKLAELMIEYNVGVADYRTFRIKKLDMDYFEEG